MKFPVQPCWVISLILLTLSLRAEEAAVVYSIEPTDLIEYEEQSPEIQRLIEEALALTKRNLNYKFGSNSPENGGMDCSGTVQHTLLQVGMKDVPRSSYKMYHWANDHGTLTSTRSALSVDDPVFDELAPGDLLFWEGTYEVKDRDPPISHVMIYLGRMKSDGMAVMYGASSGRHYRRNRINGVSVFDWRIPRPQDSSKFVAYGPVPGLIGGLGSDANAEGAGGEETSPEEEVPSAVVKPSGEKKQGLNGLKSVLENVFRKPEAFSR